MIVSRFRRTTTAIALVTALMTGLAVIGGGVATAQGSEQQVRTSLSIHAGKPAVKPGGKAVIRGALVVRQGPPPAGSELTLLAKAKGEAGFTPIGVDTTGARGGVRLAVHPVVTTRYRWDFAGTAGLKASHSGVVRVRVHAPAHPHRRLVTSLAIRASKAPNGPSGTAIVTSRLRSRSVELGDKPVLLLSRPRGTDSWFYEGAQRTDRDGRVAFRVAPESATRYRTAFLGSVLFRAARSGVVAVIPGPNALTITATPKRLEPGASSTVSGVLTHEGAAYSGQVVELLARVVGSGPRAVESTAVSDADGVVTFTVTPAKTTLYRLRLPHAEGVPGAHSKVVTVLVKAKTSLSVRGRATAADYVVSGVLRGPGKSLNGRKVTLQELTTGAPDWSDVASRRTGRLGKVAFHQATAPGTSYRLTYAGGARYAASTSGIVTQ